MIKMIQSFAAILAGIAVVNCGHNVQSLKDKLVKSVPTITHSLVNLGKMDIAIHFNNRDGRESGFKLDMLNPSKSYQEPSTEECACSQFNNLRNSNPSDIIQKILKSNDLFSTHGQPTLSKLCCDSHEVREESIFFDLEPKQNQMKASQPTLFFEPLLPIQRLINPRPIKKAHAQNTFEIFLFPKNQLKPNKPIQANKDLQIVGGKKMENDIEKVEWKPKTTSVKSVKKDLGTDLEKDVKKEIDVSVTKVAKPTVDLDVANAGKANAV